MSDSSFPPAEASPGPEQPRNAKAEAKAAKAYAKASRPWFQKKRWWVVGAVFAVIIAIAASGGGGSEDEPQQTASESNSSVDEPAEEPAEEPKDEAAEEPAKEEKKPVVKRVKVVAAEMVKEFEKNELVADTKHKGKDLKIRGVVESIDTDLFDADKYILAIGDGSDYAFTFVNCNDMSTDELASLEVGQDVTVVGKFDDGGDLGVEVKDCMLA